MVHRRAVRSVGPASNFSPTGRSRRPASTAGRQVKHGGRRRRRNRAIVACRRLEPGHGNNRDLARLPAGSCRLERLAGAKTAKSLWTSARRTSAERPRKLSLHSVVRLTTVPSCRPVAHGRGYRHELFAGLLACLPRQIILRSSSTSKPRGSTRRRSGRTASNDTEDVD